MEGLGKEKGEGIGQKVGGNKEVGLQGSWREIKEWEREQRSKRERVSLQGKYISLA